MNCADCGREILWKHPCCRSCEFERLKKDLCKWCGKEPRKPKPPHRNSKQSEYCEACFKECLAALHQQQEDYGRSRSPHHNDRPRDAREDTYETKHGKDD